MILLVRKPIGEKAHEWEILGCLAENSIGEYKLLMKNGRPPQRLEGYKEHSLIEVIGTGAFGIVIRAHDIWGVSRAIKVFFPSNVLKIHKGVRAPAGWDDAQTHRDEILLTNRVPFKNVIAIAHDGVTTPSPPPENLPSKFRIEATAPEMGKSDRLNYTVSPLVDGVNMEDFFKMIDRSVRNEIEDDPVAMSVLHDHVLMLFRDVLSGLVELREADVIHMDIKPPNIMVFSPTASFRPMQKSITSPEFVRILKQPDKRWEAFILDLGIAKSVSKECSGSISIVLSPPFFPENFLRSLAQEKYRSGFVDAEQLRKFGAAIDLNMFGKVIWSLLMDKTELYTKSVLTPNTEQQREEEGHKIWFWRKVFADDYDVLAGLARELVKSKPRPYLKPDEYLRRLQTIPLRSDKDIYASAFLTDRHPRVKIRCGKVLARLGSPFDEIIDHPQFQRLRRMAQLAFVSEVFPEATHTRFSHSLRTFELAKEAIRFLTPKSMFRLIFTRRDVDHLLVAALLHDIGQYPFAHTIEDLRELGDLVDNERLKKIPNDRELVVRVISEGRKDQWGRSIRNILESHGFNIDDILYCIHKGSERTNASPALRVSHELIAQVLDLDRVAYLLQDSEKSGVPYGNAVDVESLLDAMTIVGSYDDLAERPEVLRLGIEESGISAAEAVIAAVYWMYRNVYWRHTNRAFMAIIKLILKHAIRNGFEFETYWEETQGMSDWDALKYLHSLYEKFREVQAVNPLESLISFKRIGYSRIKTIHPITGSASLHKKIHRKLRIDSEETIAAIVEEYLREQGLSVSRNSVLVDIPLKNYLPRRLNLPVVNEHHLSRRRPAESMLLLQYSKLASQVVDMENEARIRIFFSKELRDQIPEELKATIEDSLLDQVEKRLNKKRLPESDFLPLPTKGKIFISVRDSDKKSVIPIAQSFQKMDFEICATSGTAKILAEAGIKVQTLFKLAEGRPNVLDLIKNGELQMVINTPASKAQRADEVKIRTAAVQHKISIMTTLASANAAALGIAALREKGLSVRSLQEYHKEK